MKIQILGTGCQKCKNLTENTQKAAQELGLDCEIEKITEMDQILAFGVIMTPALVVDGVVKATGKLLTSDEIKEYLS